MFSLNNNRSTKKMLAFMTYYSFFFSFYLLKVCSSTIPITRFVLETLRVKEIEYGIFGKGSQISTNQER